MFPLILRVLLFAAIGILLWRIARYFLAFHDRDAPPEAFEPTRRCEGCGTHVPADQLSGKPPRCRRCRADAN